MPRCDASPTRSYRTAGTGLLRRYRSGGGSHHGAPLGVDGGSDDGGGGGQREQEARSLHRPGLLGEGKRGDRPNDRPTVRIVVGGGDV